MSNALASSVSFQSPGLQALAEALQESDSSDVRGLIGSLRDARVDDDDVIALASGNAESFDSARVFLAVASALGLGPLVGRMVEIVRELSARGGTREEARAAIYTALSNSKNRAVAAAARELKEEL